MQVLTDCDGYVLSYAEEGMLVKGVEVENPADLEYFRENFRAYMQAGNALVYDPAKAEALENGSLAPTQEERITELEEALRLLLSGVTE